MLAPLACLICSSASHAASMSPEDKEFVVSLGAERTTRSLTGEVTDQPKWAPSIGISYRSGQFFASTERGLGYNVYQEGGLTGFVAIGADPGRKAGDRKSSPRLVGMGKVDSSALGMLGANYTAMDGLLSLTAVHVASTTRSQGSQTLINATVSFPLLGDKLTGYLSLGAAYADRKHAQTYYGVSAAQSAQSGNPVYAAKSGWVSCDTHVGVNYVLDKNWSAGASLGRHERLGAASQGPLFSTKKATVGATSVSYRF
jgi:outer membrane scaffolding protein for murein synthesis (MipA/OmpV family)